MIMPKQSRGVNRVGAKAEPYHPAGIEPSRCDTNEDCRRRGPNYPCGNWRNPGRMCASYFDDPVCLTRRSACRGELVACAAGVLGTVAYGTACAGCLYAVGWTPALASCAVPCLATAASMQLVIQNCS
ncbi:hypothetical protein Q31b_33830 [Novipirellula aureliae]|uniref:Uncharacterized protein n=1 Tax=Novipirellula aureliae TaxID=2527966 RepID=A0A5C6DYR3_9BACT|nr:hypothetical protein Q31b_33830 [Novipirellula aureliae]